MPLLHHSHFDSTACSPNKSAFHGFHQCFSLAQRYSCLICPNFSQFARLQRLGLKRINVIRLLRLNVVNDRLHCRNLPERF
jgi:hypothetical protein